MLKGIQDFFRDRLAANGGDARDQHSLQLATAALLFEMLRADHAEHSDEHDALKRALQQTFSLTPSETHELARLAEREADEAVSLYQFTALINQSFTPQEKVRVVEMLWQVAYADGHLDRYEEALVRKIAELIHVPHRDFIRAKHRIQKVANK